MKETKFIVVLVKSGIPASVEAYDNYDTAAVWEQEIRKDLNESFLLFR